jgi:CxxC motif-containing protein
MNESKREMICITCPTGCALEVIQDAAGAVTVRGNACKRGEAFARAELTNPTRSVTGTVATNFAHLPYLPVRTDREIPKARVFDCVRYIADLTITQPVVCGDFVGEEIPGCGGARLLATSDLPASPAQSAAEEEATAWEAR